MVESIFHVSQRLSRAPRVLQLLRVDPEAVDVEAFHGLIFQIQLSFIVSHEYAHHIHRHCGEDQAAEPGVWSEFPHDATRGGINSQAQELVADSYAEYLVLEHLLRGRRQSALQQLGREDVASADTDEALLTCFFLAVLAYFYSFWRGGSDMPSLYRSTHPSTRVRINYAINVAEMWCGQNGSVPESWFALSRFQALFSAAAEAVGGTAGQTRDAEQSLLLSAQGAKYTRQLSERFESLRRKRDE